MPDAATTELPILAASGSRVYPATDPYGDPSLNVACETGEAELAMGAEIARRCNAYPALRAFAEGIASGRVAGPTAAAVWLLGQIDSPGDWQIDEAMNGRR